METDEVLERGFVIHQSFILPAKIFYLFQNIFPLANSFAKWGNVRCWQAPYGTQMARISTFLGGACLRH